LYTSRVGYASFIGTEVSQNVGLRNSDESFLPTKRSSVRFNSLYNSVYGFQMFPYESTNSDIIGNRLKGTIRQLITSLRTFDRDIVGERLRKMRDLWSKNMGDIALENSWRVGPSHREDCQTKGAQGSIESRHISRLLMELTLVERDIEV
jgi:hypothetical protein